MKFRMSSKFGSLEEVRDGRVHNGIDLAIPEGSTLRSIADGVIEKVTDYGSESIGQGVIIKLQDGTRAIYGHMSEIDVKVGESIKAGEVIGLSGNTGHSTGAHLHFGLWKDGEYLDPTPYADTLANISGDVGNGLFTLTTPLGNYVIDNVKSRVREKSEEMTREIVLGILDALRDIVVDLSYSIALVGGGLCIIFKVAGWDDGYKWAGILSVAYVLIKFLLGG
jgi:hypothetical protein